jgi:ribonuclease HIII
MKEPLGALFSKARRPMAEKLYDIEKRIPLKDFSAAFTPYIRATLDEAQIKNFLSVWVKHRVRLYKDAEPLSWIQHLSVLDAVVMDFDVERSLQWHIKKMKEMHPVIAVDLQSRAAKFKKISIGVASARDNFIKTMNNIFAQTGNQVP